MREDPQQLDLFHELDSLDKNFSFSDYDAFVEKLSLFRKLLKKELHPVYAMLNLTSKLGNIANKMNGFFGDSHKKYNKETMNSFNEELGEILFFITALAHEFGFTLEDIAKGNIRSKRKSSQ